MTNTSQLELFPVYNLNEQLQDYISESGIMFGFFIFLRDEKLCDHMAALSVPLEMHIPYLGACSVGSSSAVQEPSSDQ